MNDNDKVVQFDPKPIDPKAWKWASESVIRYKGRMSPQRVLREIRAVYEAILRGESV